MKGFLRYSFRFLGAAVLVTGLAFVGFAAYKGRQPMHIQAAKGMTYWQFMGERIHAIRQLPAKCQQMHFTGYILAVPLYPVLYTFVGVFPNSFLTGHLQPDVSIPNEVRWYEAPGIWWSLVETVTWEAWVTPHVPGVLPECNLNSPTK